MRRMLREYLDVRPRLQHQDYAHVETPRPGHIDRGADFQGEKA